MECFLEHPSPAGGQLAAQQSVEFVLGTSAHLVAPAQEFAAHVLELGVQGATVQATALSTTHLVDRLIEVRADVETVQDVEGVAGFGGNDLEVGLPHVATDETQAGNDVRSKRRQAPA